MIQQTTGVQIMPLQTANVPSAVDLNLEDLTKIYWTIRARQDDCRKVTEEFSGYPVYRAIDLELDVLNYKVAQAIQVLRAKQ